MRLPLVCLSLLLSACAGASSSEPAKPKPRADRRAPAFVASALRQPALVVRVQIVGQFNARQVASWPAEYEGALLEGLNARAVPARDVRLLSSRDRFARADAVARAREVGADHALLVDARLHQTETTFCRDARPFRTIVPIWSQKLTVLRASDGGVAWETNAAIDVPAFDPDCDAPKESTRRSPAEHTAAAVDALLKRLLGP